MYRNYVFAVLQCMASKGKLPSLEELAGEAKTHKLFCLTSVMRIP